MGRGSRVRAVASGFPGTVLEVLRTGMLLVRAESGQLEVFWPGELELASTEGGAMCGVSRKGREPDTGVDEKLLHNTLAKHHAERAGWTQEWRAVWPSGWSSDPAAQDEGDWHSTLAHAERDAADRLYSRLESRYVSPPRPVSEGE